jgi:hypothetical protein
VLARLAQTLAKSKGPYCDDDAKRTSGNSRHTVNLGGTRSKGRIPSLAAGSANRIGILRLREPIRIRESVRFAQDDRTQSQGPNPIVDSSSRSLPDPERYGSR